MLSRNERQQTPQYKKWLDSLPELTEMSYTFYQPDSSHDIIIKANKEHFAFLKWLYNVNLISAKGECETFPGELKFDYLPPDAVRFAWYFIEDRLADPLEVAKYRLEGEKRKKSFDLVTWSNQFQVENTLDLVNLLRINQEGKKLNMLTMTFKREIIANVIISDLQHKGIFYFDISVPLDLRAKALYWHDNDTGLLYFASRLTSFIMKEYRIFSREEKNAVLDQLEAVAYNEATGRDIFTLYQWDYKKLVLDYSTGNGKILSLDGTNIKERSNGKELIFRDILHYEGFDLMTEHKALKSLKNLNPYGYFAPPPDFAKGNKALETALFKLTAQRCNFSDSSIFSIAQQQILYFIILHALPFVTLMESVPIVSAHGEPGAGKTFSMTQLAKFVLGIDYKPEPLPENREDFWTILGDNRILIFDNVEFLPKWLPDSLASVATGVRKTKRARYTDWDVTTVDPRLFILLTSVRAPYRQPAVVERLIPLSFAKFDRTVEKESALPVLFESYSEFRNELMSLFINNLNKIVKTIKKRGGLRGKTTHRMGDFAILAELINEALELSPQKFFKQMMDDLVKQRSAFALFDEPWFNALAHVFKDNKGIGFSIKEVTEKINEITEEGGKSYTAGGIGKLLKNYHHDLNTVFSIRRKTHAGKSMIYAGVKIEPNQDGVNDFFDSNTVEPGKQKEPEKGRFTRAFDAIIERTAKPTNRLELIDTLVTILSLDKAYIESTITSMITDGTLFRPRRDLIAKS